MENVTYVNLSYFISELDIEYNTFNCWDTSNLALWYCHTVQAKNCVNIKVANETLCWRI